MSGFRKPVGDTQFETGYREQLGQVGRYLKGIRIEKGFSLQQVAQRTHIQLKQLQAIEAGNYLQLPETIYVKGFLKCYAQFLDLDGVKISETLCANPPALNPRWLNQSNFSTQDQRLGMLLTSWWTRLTPSV